MERFYLNLNKYFISMATISIFIVALSLILKELLPQDFMPKIEVPKISILIKCSNCSNQKIEEETKGVKQVKKIEESKLDQGSIMMVLATDLPVSDRQLKRILKR